MKKLLFFSMMCLAALTMQAQKRCVVLDFQVGSNVTEKETDAISNSFRLYFLPSGYTKLEQPLVTRTIRDFGYSRTDMTRQQIVRVGRELEANIIVMGTLNKFKDVYRVDILVIDVAKDTTTANQNATFYKATYREAMEKTARKLASKLRGGATTSSSGADATTGYTDLGLPSGTIWKNFNATGFYTYDEAVSQFGYRLPTKAQWKELKAECQWTWNGSGYKVTGPNGNSIVLPASGYRGCDGNVNNVGSSGDYWSISPYGSGKAMSLYLGSDGVLMISSGCCYGLSVRLVQD